MALTNNQESLIRLYLASFNRAPEKNGLDYWAGQLAAGKSFASIVSTIFSLDIVKAIYPDSLPDDAFLTQIYINVFNKVPDDPGLAYWVGKLALGAQRSALVMDMINAGLGTPDGTPGKAFIANRVAAAQYAVNVQLAQKVSLNVTTLKIITSFVTDDPASVAVANKAIDGINTGGLDAPANPLSIPAIAATGFVNAAIKTAGVVVTVDLTGTNAVAGNTVLVLVNDALFPTSVTKILVAADITARKTLVTIPGTAGWGADGVKILSVRIADVPTGHIGPAGGNLTLGFDGTAPGAPGGPITFAIASEAVSGINAAQKAAGVAVQVNLTGTNAAAGDTVQLFLAGATTPTQTQVLTASDISALRATLTIASTAAWGIDGSKTLTARIADAAGNVGPIGGNVSVLLDTVTPTLTASSPADNATAVPIASKIVMTFSESMAAGIGNIIVSDGATDIRTIAVGDATQVKIVGSTVTITPTTALSNGTNYYVQLASGVLVDVAGNNYAGIVLTTALNFTTAAVPVVSVSGGSTLISINPAALYDVSDTAANLTADAATNGGAGTVITGHNVSFTDVPSIAQLTLVDLATTGLLTYTGVTDSVSILLANTSGYVAPGKNITVTDAASLAQLGALDTANTTGTLTYSANGVVDTVANLSVNAGGYVKAGIKVTVTDAATIAQLNAIDTLNTTAAVTHLASVTDTASNLTADAILNAGAGKYVTGHNVVFTNAASIAQLTSVDAATTGTLNYGSGIIDTAANLATDAALNAGAGKYVTGHDLIFTGAASIAQLTAIDAATTGTLTYASGVTDTAANLASDAAANGGAGRYVNGHNVSFSNVVTIAQLSAVDAATTGSLTYASGVSDTAANLAGDAATNGGLGTYVTGHDVSFTNSASIAQLTAVDSATTGLLSYGSISDTASAVFSGIGTYVTAGKNITISSAATVAQLGAIDAANTTGTLSYAALTGTAAQLYHGAAADAYITAGVNVTVTDVVTLTQLAAIDTANGAGTLSYASGIADAYAGYSATAQIISLINAAAPGSVTLSNSGAESGLNVSALTAGVTINGNASVETLIGGAGDDVITGGAGADTLTGNGGADKFKYVAAGTGGDTITDFAVGTDFIQYTAALANGTSTNATALSVQYLSAATAITSNVTIYNYQTALASTTVAAVAAASLANGGLGFSTGTENAGDKLLIVVHSATTTAIYEFASVTQDDLISVNELTLLATLIGVTTGLVTANGADFLTL